MKTAGVLAAFFVLALLAAFLFVRSRLELESWTAVLEPAGAAARQVPLDVDAPLEAVREQVGKALLAAHAAAPEQTLRITVQLRVVRRTWRVGLPPWSTISDVRQDLSYALHARPDRAPGWIPQAGQDYLEAVPLDQARESVLDAMTRHLRRHRELRRAFR